MKRIAVFASGSGTNFQSIVDSVHSGRLQAKVEILVCDRPDAFVIERAKAAGVATFVFNPKEYKSKPDFEREIAAELLNREVDFLVLAGYMRLIGNVLLKSFPGRIVNIHPSLLPSFPGKDAVGQAIDAGVKVTGVTVHFVDEGMDTGPIIAQEVVRISPFDNRQTLQQKIQDVEHRLYPETLTHLFMTSIHNV
ncbi:phosphoribosylglycinamide formyltransferase [Rossellomorea vietnamensis]|uniref:Phosphoribosylglycinamide formyltransferase n=1 Tax=Rossellomorea vietnamensis TaxID=218284 RepID=A0A5D4NSU6_9BACI|nr:phosphoribosylglycinamide formyltransferase [Rossellomorea vietnamensis]TYS16929.1 phosphoribosylglycinamide formyltransferase [Rossellomorea vietnamensis]